MIRQIKQNMNEQKQRKEMIRQIKQNMNKQKQRKEKRYKEKR